MTDQHLIKGLRSTSPEAPLKILMSARSAGELYGYNATSNGKYPRALKLQEYNTEESFVSVQRL